MFAYVENNIVKEVCRNESPFNVFFPAYASLFISCPEWVVQGDTFDGNTWSKAPIPKPVISPVSPRQIRQALTRINLRSAVESAVSAGDQDLKDWWEFATSVERQHPMVVSMAQALNVSDAQLDELFILAGTL